MKMDHGHLMIIAINCYLNLRGKHVLLAVATVSLSSFTCTCMLRSIISIYKYKVLNEQIQSENH